jgi:heptosyltransferase-1
MLKVLVVKTSALGDIIHCFPAIEALASKGATIDWVAEVSTASLVEAHPLIRKVHCLNSKKWRKNFYKPSTWRKIQDFKDSIRKEDYDIVFDLQGNIKSGWITWNANAKMKIGYGRATAPEWPNTFFSNARFNPPSGKTIREDYLFFIESYFDEKFKKPVKPSLLSLASPPIALEPSEKKRILVSCGSNWKNKQVTPEALAIFLKRIDQSDKVEFFFIWGSPQEKIVVEDLAKQFPGRSRVMDKMPISQLQHFMDAMDLVIAMDSLPLHLSATTSTPSFSIFGSSSAQKYKPPGSSHHAFQGECPYGVHFSKRCKRLRTCKTGACIRDLDGNEIFDSYKSTRSPDNGKHTSLSPLKSGT